MQNFKSARPFSAPVHWTSLDFEKLPKCFHDIVAFRLTLLSQQNERKCTTPSYVIRCKYCSCTMLKGKYSRVNETAIWRCTDSTGGQRYTRRTKTCPCQWQETRDLTTVNRNNCCVIPRDISFLVARLCGWFLGLWWASGTAYLFLQQYCTFLLHLLL